MTVPVTTAPVSTRSTLPLHFSLNCKSHLSWERRMLSAQTWSPRNYTVGICFARITDSSFQQYSLYKPHRNFFKNTFGWKPHHRSVTHKLVTPESRKSLPQSRLHTTFLAFSPHLQLIRIECSRQVSWVWGGEGGSRYCIPWVSLAHSPRYKFAFLPGLSHVEVHPLQTIPLFHPFQTTSLRLN